MEEKPAGQPGTGDHILGGRPDDSWRADALATSRHARLLDELSSPVDGAEPDDAQALCAAVCRDLLGDLSPVFILLARDDRQRAQALIAFTRTLFSFARGSAMHGDRLARINRWEFDLEEALAGAAIRQPVFLALASAHEHTPWDLEALGSIVGVARRVAVSDPLDPADQTLVAAFLTAMTGSPPSSEIIRLCQRIVSSLVRQRTGSGREGQKPPENLRRDLDRIDLSLLPRPFRRCLVYLARASDALAERRAVEGGHLGLVSRLRLLGGAWLA